MKIPLPGKMALYQWLYARLQYLYWTASADTTVLQEVMTVEIVLQLP